MAADGTDAPETDAGPRDRRGPSRTCIATREVGPPAAMIRFVVGPDGTVVPDLKGALPGRGAWVTASRGAVESAVKRRAFARAFRREVVAGPALPAEVDALLARAALEALALCNKAGGLVAGFHKVEEALAAGRVAALLHAADAAPDGVDKLARAAARAAGTATRPPVIDSFPSEQLNLALGRPNVIHAAVLAGPAGSGFLARWKRLDHYRSGDRPG